MTGPRAIRARRTVVALTRKAVADDVAGDGVIEVLTDEEIEPAIAIDVHERGGNAPPDRCGTHSRRVGEGAVAVITQELIRSKLVT